MEISVRAGRIAGLLAATALAVADATAQPTLATAAGPVTSGVAVTLMLTGTPGHAYAVAGSTVNAGFIFGGASFNLGTDIAVLAVGTLDGAGTAAVQVLPPFRGTTLDRYYVQAATSPNAGFTPIQLSNGLVIRNADVTGNLVGPPGPTGASGPAGPAGPAGPQGPAGPIVSVAPAIGTLVGQVDMNTASSYTLAQVSITVPRAGSVHLIGSSNAFCLCASTESQSYGLALTTSPTGVTPLAGGRVVGGTGPTPIGQVVAQTVVPVAAGTTTFYFRAFTNVLQHTIRFTQAVVTASYFPQP